MVRIEDPDRLSIPPDARSDEEQPQWRKDFAIDWPKDDFIARRDFTKFMVLTSFAFVVGPVLDRLSEPGAKQEGSAADPENCGAE